MSDCRDLDLLSSYIDSELTAAELARVESHLPDCRSCREQLRDLRETKAMIASGGPLHAPVDLTESILAQINARRAEIEAERRGISWWAAGVAAAAAAVAVWIGARNLAPQPAIPLDALVAAHYRAGGDNVHDTVQSAAIYSDYVKKTSDGPTS
ncbi:MAG: zf-HC2 domain-containing protein [Elusimicrobia bacterium]|nr:zf-HC2 domain-containing protein [Elusimicrobiota bacterium]